MIRRSVPAVVLLAMLASPITLAMGSAPEAPGNQEPTTMKTIAQANNQFAFDLYDHLRAGDGNLFYSPYSISTALSMVLAGAEGASAREMADTLHLADTAATHDAVGELISNLNQRGETGPNTLTVANALWAHQGFTFLDAYLDLIRQAYRSEVEQVDFVNDSEGAREAINAWVERKTREKIQQLIAPGVLNPRTRAVLVNAIYFKGTWAETFSESKTLDRPFYRTPDDAMPVPMMEQTETFSYTEDDTVQVLAMPYEGHDMSLVVFLPRAKDGLRALEAAWNAGTVEKYVKALTSRKVHVLLPRFVMESSFSLAQVLGALGMGTAFTQAADFSGMTGGRDLMITDVLHKAYVSVDEEGTEAAAATGVVMGLTSVAHPQQPVVFRADHPFLFAIRDDRSGALLFIGRLTKPE